MVQRCYKTYQVNNNYYFIKQTLNNNSKLSAADVPAEAGPAPPAAVPAVQGVAALPQVHEGQQHAHQEAIPQVEGEELELIEVHLTYSNGFFAVPPVSPELRPGREEPHAGEGDRQHPLQGQEDVVLQEVRRNKVFNGKGV